MLSPSPTGCLPSSEEWGLLRVARGRELGSLERVGEKMANISSKMSLLDIRAMEERVATAEVETREAREAHEARAQLQIHDARLLAEEAWQQSEEAREGEARAQLQIHDARQLAEEAWQQSEEAREGEARAQEARQQADAARQQVDAARQQVDAARQQAEEALQQSEASRQQAQEARQQAEEEAREREEQLQEQVRRAEQRAQLAEQRAAQEEPFWEVGREEIELQEGEELGRGGWAVVKVAKFRGALVAAKCLHGVIASRLQPRAVRSRDELCLQSPPPKPAAVHRSNAAWRVSHTDRAVADERSSSDGGASQECPQPVSCRGHLHQPGRSPRPQLPQPGQTRSHHPPRRQQCQRPP